MFARTTKRVSYYLRHLVKIIFLKWYPSDLKTLLHSILPWCRFCEMVGSFSLRKQSILLSWSSHLYISYVITVSLMIFFNFLTIFQLSFTIFLDFHESLQSIDSLSNYVNVISLNMEYVGRDLITTGNCPVPSKFDLLQSWSLPLHGMLLLLFVGSCFFYNQCYP